MTNNLHLLECDSVYRGFTKGILYAYSDRFEFITQNGECTKYMFCDIEYVCLSQLKTFNLKMKNNLSVISFGAKNNSVFLQWIDLAKQYDVPVAKSKDFEKQMINIKNNIFTHCARF